MIFSKSTHIDKDRVELNNSGNVQDVSCGNGLVAGPPGGEALELVMEERRRGLVFCFCFCFFFPINSLAH